MAGRHPTRIATRRARGDQPTRRPHQPALAERRRQQAILKRLGAEYKNATTALQFDNAFQLLVAVILSAQCTDVRVNLVTPALFKKFPTPQSFAALAPSKLEPYIHSCGFFRSKAKSIVGASREIVTHFQGEVPRSMDELLTLPGVGRKTANVILAVAFGSAAIAVDTHVFRVANRLRLARAATPDEVERQLMRVVPRAHWSDAHHWLIHHGREVCHARKPRCVECVVFNLCPSGKQFVRAGLAARPVSDRPAVGAKRKTKD